MLKKISTALLVAASVFSLSAFAGVDSQSSTSNINNNSSQNSTGIVTNSPVYQTAIGETPYNRINGTSCAAPQVYGAVGSSGENYFDQGSATIGFSYSFGGETCKKAAEAELARIRDENHRSLEKHCVAMLETGYVGTDNKCDGFERTELGNLKAQNAMMKVSVENSVLQAQALQQKLNLIQTCREARNASIHLDECIGVPTTAPFLHKTN